MYTRLLNLADDDESEYGGVGMIFGEKWIGKIISVPWINRRLIKILNANLVL